MARASTLTHAPGRCQSPQLHGALFRLAHPGGQRHWLGEGQSRGPGISPAAGRSKEAASTSPQVASERRGWQRPLAHGSQASSIWTSLRSSWFSSSLLRLCSDPHHSIWAAAPGPPPGTLSHFLNIPKSWQRVSSHLGFVYSGSLSGVGWQCPTQTETWWIGQGRGGSLLLVTRTPWPWSLAVPWIVEEEVGEFSPLKCARRAVGKWCFISLFLRYQLPKVRSSVRPT